MFQNCNYAQLLLVSIIVALDLIGSLHCKTSLGPTITTQSSNNNLLQSKIQEYLIQSNKTRPSNEVQT